MMPRARKTNNRTDLLTPKPEKITTAPGQTYGKQTAQQQSQRIVPIGAQPTAGPSTAAGNRGATPGAPAPAPAIAQNPAPSPLAPGQLAWAGLTERPDEPQTAGLRGQPQPGSLLALANQQRNSVGTARQLLTYLASIPGASNTIQGMAQALGAHIE